MTTPCSVTAFRVSALAVGAVWAMAGEASSARVERQKAGRKRIFLVLFRILPSSGWIYVLGMDQYIVQHSTICQQVSSPGLKIPCARRRRPIWPAAEARAPIA